jgi:hypothetical protein
MDVSANHAHVQTLRELWLTDSDLSFLESLEEGVLARLTAEVRAHNARVEASLRPLYETMARATRFIPNFMVQRLGSSLSPYVRARITEHLEPKSAAALAKHIPPEELAEISLHLEAPLVAQIAAHQDVDTLVVITGLLAQKGLVRRLGEISDALDERMLEKVVERMRDPERLAQVAAHMTAMEKLRASRAASTASCATQ